jgi:hypothetical protein
LGDSNAKTTATAKATAIFWSLALRALLRPFDVAQGRAVWPFGRIRRRAKARLYLAANAMATATATAKTKLRQKAKD